MPPMIDINDDTLTWVWAAPLLAGLVCFAFGRAPLLWTRLLIALVAQGVALGTALFLGARVLSRGGFALFDVDGWVGARILATDPTGMLGSTLAPSQVPLLVAVELAGLLTVGLVAHHGRDARSSAASAAVLWATGMCALLVVARDTAVVAAAFAGAGVAGFALLVCFHPKRPEVEGAVRLFVIHRVGDALVLVAVLIVGASLGAGGHHLQLDALATSAPALDAWSRATSGPFTGFAVREVWMLAAALLAAGACTRLLGVPLARDAVGAPGAVLGFAHGVCFTGAALVLAFRATPLLWLAPEVLTGLGVAAVLGAVIAAVLAASARDVVRSDVLLLGGFGCLGALAAATADPATLVLAASVLMLGAVPLCAASGAVLDATGTADPHALGGLEKIMPRTHTTRLLAGGALFGPVFAGASIATHVVERALFAPWLGSAPLGAAAGALGTAVGTAAILGALIALSLAAFRPLHLAFTGKTPREPMPATSKPGAPAPADPPATRMVPALATALVLLGAGLAHLPTGVVALLPNVERYRSPLQVLFEPERVMLEPLRLHLLQPTGPAMALQLGQSPLAVSLLVVTALALGWLASTLLYRGGPGRLHHALVGGRRARKVVALVTGVAGGESQVVRGVGEGAIRLSRMIATNLAPGVLDTLLRRLPSLFGFLVGFIVRLIANGNAQRGIAVAVIVLVVLLWRFAEGPR